MSQKPLDGVKKGFDFGLGVIAAYLAVSLFVIVGLVVGNAILN
jgi:hypothetical protein